MMKVKRRLMISLTAITIMGKLPLLSAPDCDRGLKERLGEGIIRSSGQFPWLGMLKVQVGESVSRMAVTGLVLVKRRYAVASANDLARVPLNVLKKNSKAMFFHRLGRPWHCRLNNYIFNQDDDSTSSSTIALVELRLKPKHRPFFKPVCWTRRPFDMSLDMFVIGFTDDNIKMEKMMYLVKYVRQKLCDLYYKTKKLPVKSSKPVHGICALATNFTQDCIWETGMALVTNYTGQWTLLGLSVRGAGCAAPTRYIDVYPYLPWINAVTRKTKYGQNRGSYPGDYRRQEEAEEEVEEEATTTEAVPLYMFYGKHDFRLDEVPFEIYRMDKDALLIQYFDDMYERHQNDCMKYKTLAYRDRFRIVDDYRHEGTAVYRLSMHYMAIQRFSCVKLQVKAKKRSQATLYYRVVYDNEVFNLTKYQATPNELLRNYGIKTKVPELWDQYHDYGGKTRPRKFPGRHLRPRPVEAAYIKKITNLNILFWVTFKGTAFMELQVYGVPQSPFIPTTRTTSTTTTVTTTYRTKPPTKRTKPRW